MPVSRRLTVIRAFSFRCPGRAQKNPPNIFRGIDSIDQAERAVYGSMPRPSIALRNRRNTETVRVQLERRTPGLSSICGDGICVEVAIFSSAAVYRPGVDKSRERKPIKKPPGTNVRRGRTERCGHQPASARLLLPYGWYNNKRTWLPVTKGKSSCCHCIRNTRDCKTQMAPRWHESRFTGVRPYCPGFRSGVNLSSGSANPPHSHLTLVRYPRRSVRTHEPRESPYPA